MKSPKYILLRMDDDNERPDAGRHYSNRPLEPLAHDQVSLTTYAWIKPWFD